MYTLSNFNIGLKFFKIKAEGKGKEILREKEKYDNKIYNVA